MATTLNMVTVGNDFVLKVKVGMVQYSNDSVEWDYMDLTTCRNIVFNISCTKHDIDINLPYTIDQTDHAVISATVRAEMLHENSIYNFSITGIDSAGYRWTYISPKQQSFITTNVSQDSANAYTELAFTAGMIMPLAAQGKDGFTPYIGPNNNWWINGEDTGVSAIADIDLSDYATKEYVDDAIESIPAVDLTSYASKQYVDDAIDNIDIPEVDLSSYATKAYVTNAIENIDIPEVDLTDYYTKSETEAEITNAIENIEIPVTDEMIDGNANYIRGNIAFDGGSTWYILSDNYDFATQISATIPNGLDTGIELADDIKVEVRFSVGMEMPGPAYSIGYCPLFAQSPIDDYVYFRMGLEGNHCQVMINNNQYNFNAVYNTGEDINYNDRIYTYGATLAYGFIDGRQASDYSTASLSWETAMAQRSESDIHFIVPFNLYQFIYNIKFYKNNILIANMIPTTTQNGDGFHDDVRDIDIVSPYMKFCKRNSGYYTREFTQRLIDAAKEQAQNNASAWIDQQTPMDCTSAIDLIINNGTITSGWDIQSLWEASCNADYHKYGGGRYNQSVIDIKTVRDDNNQQLESYYYVWVEVEKCYYDIHIIWDYNNQLDNRPTITKNKIDYATISYMNSQLANLKFEVITESNYNTALLNNELDNNTLYIIL